MDGGEAAFAFDDEAHGEGSVAVGRGGFVGHDELEAGVDGVGGEWCFCERRESRFITIIMRGLRSLRYGDVHTYPC